MKSYYSLHLLQPHSVVLSCLKLDLNVTFDLQNFINLSSLFQGNVLGKRAEFVPWVVNLQKEIKALHPILEYVKFLFLCRRTP